MNLATNIRAAASDYPRMARRLIRDARNRAPSFVLLNHCFSAGLAEMNLSEADEEAVRNAAREIFAAEKETP